MSNGLTPAEQTELATLEAAFDHLGGRGVEIAERIDFLRAKRDDVGTYAIEITNDNGIVVIKDGNDGPGQYIGVDAPWQGDPNVFVSENFSDAKQAAIDFLQEQIDMYQEWIDEVLDVQMADARVAR